MKKELTILGSTGSIGTTALSIENINEHFSIHALVAGNDYNLLIKQAIKFKPKYAVLFNEDYYEYLKSNLFGSGIKIKIGQEGVMDITSDTVDVVLSAISGSDGILPTYNCINNTAVLAIANKESIVTAGNLLFDKNLNKSTKILPVDSEHSALSKLLGSVKKKNIRKLVITASGGPFLDKKNDELEFVSVEESLKHPTWKMGNKITIDSATLINKGLELIEATYLFEIKHELIDILVHPESLIHGIISLKDGTSMAMMADADMRIPISNALFTELNSPKYGNLSLEKVGKLTFKSLDNDKFPSVKLARQALDIGPIGVISYNASSEVAVQSFILGKIKFTEIFGIIENSVANIHKNVHIQNVDNILSILKINSKAKNVAENLVKELLIDKGSKVD
ncbi:MAG: 1-deoxy-D-xylulose-5-phosphate reductoisomerase [Rhizobiales bacterium]|nr:1-deoxy-D-xylulose-5-phosphate reductoisomerase [Hyphomicrobiales bacterium]